MAPSRARPIEHIFEDFERVILPGITHWNHPRFLAFFANTSSPPAVLAELLAAALNANGILWKTLARRHGTRSRDAALAAALVRIARRLVRDDSRHRIHQHAARDRGRPRRDCAGNARYRGTARPRALYLRSGAFFGRKGRDGTGLRAPQRSPYRLRCRIPHAPRSACRGHPARSRGRVAALLRRRDRGHHFDHQHRPRRGHRRYRRTRRALAARGCRLCGIGRGRAGVSAGFSMAASAPIRWYSIRTSG